MKINELLAGQQIARTIADKKATTGINFQDLLENQLKSLSTSKEITPVTSAQEITTTSPALRVDGLSLTEDVLTHLDQFGAALAAPRTHAADLEPFVAALEEETSALVAVKGELADDDPLAALLDRVAAAAYVETVKFRRGDYSA